MMDAQLQLQLTITSFSDYLYDSDYLGLLMGWRYDGDPSDSRDGGGCILHENSSIE